jgi:sulfur carrier protein
MIAITVNGEKREVSEGTSLATLISDTRVDRRGIAVAVNQEVVPRSLWDNTIISNQDCIEIITAVPGG